MPPPTPFWEQKSLAELSRDEWESLCDGCGKCCLRKLEDVDSGEIHYTSVACRLLDTSTCRCTRYARRLELVPDCIELTPAKLAAGARETLAWMPSTCAYRLVAEGKPLPAWHPLVSGDRVSVHRAGASIRGRVVSEEHVDDREIEERIVGWPR